MSSNHRLYTALIRPKDGMKETLVMGSKVYRRSKLYYFYSIIQEGLNRGKIKVVDEENAHKPLPDYEFEIFYPSEFGCEVVY